MRLTRLPFCILLAACSGESTTGLSSEFTLAGEQPVEPMTTRFGWAVPTEVRVTEETLARGQEVISRYTIALEPATGGEGLVLHKRDFELVSVAGFDVDTAEARATLAPLTAAMQAVPPVAISATGEAGGIVGFEAYLERLRPELERMAEQIPPARQQIEMTLRMMSMPMMRPIIEQGARQPWQSWAEAWIDTELAVGEQTVVEESVALPTGELVPMQFTLLNHGVVEHPAGHIKLSMVSEASGEELGTVAVQAAQGIAAELGIADAALSPEELASVDVSMVTRIEAVTDPSTLRPFWASYERIVRASRAGEQREQVERRRYWFDWSSK